VGVLVTRVRFAGGDEYNKPERGLFLGVYVKVKALADDHSSLWGDFYVTVRGHHYDADACCPDGFTPTLDHVDLQDGETAEGWLLFDVPARRGEVVLKQSYGDGRSQPGGSDALGAGGKDGIRTHGRLATSTVFETAPFVRSGTLPRGV
jgi:hypothetical protein